MKRIFLIIVWTIGVMSVLIAPIIPHQHHGEALFMIMEKFGIDNNINDEHTEHHGDSEHEDCSSCIKNAQWLDVMAGNNRNAFDVYLLPLFVVFGYEWHVRDVVVEEKQNLYCQSKKKLLEGYGGLCGLRAPPCFC